MSREKMLLFANLIMVLGIILSFLSIYGKVNKIKLIKQAEEKAKETGIRKVEVSISSKSLIKLFLINFSIENNDLFYYLSKITFIIGGIIKVIFETPLWLRIYNIFFCLFILVIFVLSIITDYLEEKYDDC